MRTKSGRAAVLGVLTACAMTVAACGGSDSSAGDDSTGGEKVSVDVGTQKVSVTKGAKPEIAMFAGSGIAYQTAYQNEVPKLEKKFGVNITYFDSKFDPTTQLNQIREAIQSKKYNAFMVENYSSAAACNLLTKDAPKAGILVSQLDAPTCDEATKPAGDTFWSPGTLNTVGAEATVTYYTSLVREAKDLLGSETPKVAIVNGPALVAGTKNLTEAVKENGLKPLANLNSDYSAPTSLKVTADLLQSKPDVNVIFSIGADTTVGVVGALKQAGKKPGEVKVFDIAGTKANEKLITSGYQTASIPYTPKTVITVAVEQLVLAFEGKQGPRYLDALNKGTATEPFLITKETTGDYPYEY